MDFTQIIITIITAGLTFVAGRSRGKAETEGVLLLNIEKSINIYQTIIENLKDEIIQLNAKVELLQQKLDEMEKSSRPRKKV
jgi:peptidoglycan hydrolase CwlO-like protein